jgi:hypothetical protein
MPRIAGGEVKRLALAARASADGADGQEVAEDEERPGAEVAERGDRQGHDRQRQDRREGERPEVPRAAALGLAKDDAQDAARAKRRRQARAGQRSSAHPSMVRQGSSRAPQGRGAEGLGEHPHEGDERRLAELHGLDVHLARARARRSEGRVADYYFDPELDVFKPIADLIELWTGFKSYYQQKGQNHAVQRFDWTPTNGNAKGPVNPGYAASPNRPLADIEYRADIACRGKTGGEAWRMVQILLTASRQVKGAAGVLEAWTDGRVFGPGRDAEERHHDLGRLEDAAARDRPLERDRARRPSSLRTSTRRRRLRRLTR